LKRPQENDFEVVEPRAASLVESLRAFGYDLGSAIADIVDNSISAKATTIRVEFRWDGAGSTISIADDGEGMDKQALRTAMRLGSRNPNEQRGGHDLGRFGLGLKTASFSQCRCVTVISKTNGGEESVMRWDLDHLSDKDAWHVLLSTRDGAMTDRVGLKNLKSGTLVLLQDLDRVSGIPTNDAAGNKESFIRQCEEVEEYLALVFHRIIEARNGVQIIVNDQRIRPVDPFFVVEATQILQSHKLRDSNGATVIVEPFVMPHESKVTDRSAREKAGDYRDWVAKQGFYIYRQDRLLVAGSWLGFRGWRKDEYHKLARIRISITNQSDDLWQIDVTKRQAKPPEQFKEALRKIGETTRERAKRVYTFRGSRISPSSAFEMKFVWEQVVLHGKTSYRINREHPLVLAAKESGDSPSLERLLKLVEDRFPIHLIDPNQPDDGAEEDVKTSSGDDNEIRKMLVTAWHSLKDKGLDHPQIMPMLAAWEPFNAHPALVAQLYSNPPY
jgi:hypothetical protein